MSPGQAAHMAGNTDIGGFSHLKSLN